ncbi:unnamed protein product [Choristocarpus tenellus]
MSSSAQASPDLDSGSVQGGQQGVGISGPGRDGVVAELKLGSTLSAISLSFDHRHAVSGGRDIVKVLRVAPEGLSELRSLRVQSQKFKLSIMDVSWSPHGGEVAASMANGGVVVWDLEHEGDLKESGRDGGFGRSGLAVTGKVLTDQLRSVNRVNWDPSQPGILITGSQVKTEEQNHNLAVWCTTSWYQRAQSLLT